MYSRRDESFGKIRRFWSWESEHHKIITPLGFATGPSLNRTERQPIRPNHDENNPGRQQMMNGQYIKLSINGPSMICCLASTVFYQTLGRCYSYWTYWQVV